MAKTGGHAKIASGGGTPGKNAPTKDQLRTRLRKRKVMGARNRGKRGHKGEYWNRAHTRKRSETLIDHPRKPSPVDRARRFRRVQKHRDALTRAERRLLATLRKHPEADDATEVMS